MKLARTLAIASFFGLTACGGGGIEGNYELDKAEMKKGMEAEIAKLPADQQGFAKLALAMIDMMSMSMSLEAGGKVKVKSTTPSLDKGKPSKTEEKEGTWKAEGDKVTITADGKPITCTKSGSKLSCQSEKKGDPAMIFNKS